jgi:hypothetical protein
VLPLTRVTNFSIKKSLTKCLGVLEAVPGNSPTPRSDDDDDDDDDVSWSHSLPFPEDQCSIWSLSAKWDVFKTKTVRH